MSCVELVRLQRHCEPVVVGLLAGQASSRTFAGMALPVLGLAHISIRCRQMVSGTSGGSKATLSDNCSDWVTSPGESGQLI